MEAGRNRVHTQIEFLEAGDKLWEKAQLVNESIDKEIDKLK